MSTSLQRSAQVVPIIWPYKSPGSLHGGFWRTVLGFQASAFLNPVCSKGRVTLSRWLTCHSLTSSSAKWWKLLPWRACGGRLNQTRTGSRMQAQNSCSRATAITFNLSWRPKTQAKLANSSCFPDTASEHSQEFSFAIMSSGRADSTSGRLLGALKSGHASVRALTRKTGSLSRMGLQHPSPVGEVISSEYGVNLWHRVLENLLSSESWGLQRMTGSCSWKEENQQRTS